MKSLLNRKWMLFMCLCMWVLVVRTLSGCSMSKDDGNKVRDMEFSVTAEADIPQELKQIIAEKALALLRPNTALFLDSGSTTTAVARCIPDQPMLIYTSGLHCIFCYGLRFRSAVAAAKRKGGFHLAARLVSLKAKRGFHCSASLRKREFLCRVALHCQKFSV